MNFLRQRFRVNVLQQRPRRVVVLKQRRRNRWSQLLVLVQVVLWAVVATVLFSLYLLAVHHKYLKSPEKPPTAIRTNNTNHTIPNDSIASLRTNSNNTLSSDEHKREHESFDQYSWPDMKQAICPNMIPNARVWHTIFNLARAELNFEDSTTLSSEPLFSDFFRFSYGGLAFVNGEHSTVYLAVWKAANDFIRNNLKLGLEKEINQKVYESEYQTELYQDIDILTPQRDFLTKMASLWSTSSEKKACTITALRDPVSHFISAYNEIEARHQIYPEEERLPKKEENPQLFTRFQRGSTQRFKQFVTDFVGGPTQYGFYRDIAEFTHLFSMTGILYEQNRLNQCFGSNLTLTAYLPSLSNLKSTFPKLLTETCPGVPQELGKMFNHSYIHESKFEDYGFEAAGKKTWEQGGDTARALCALHVLDYACFDLIPVPGLCRQVYADRDFRNELLAAASSQNTHIIQEGCN